jgi:hypothetical protein
MTYIDAYHGRSETTIENVTTDDDVTLTFDRIDFSPYGNPSVSADSAGRFAVHEIVGGSTVRQKLGEEPREITVDGVCTEDVAQQVNELHKAELVSLNSETLNDIIRCHVGSTSTEPIEPGGAADMDGGDFLYDFSISLVEVETYSEAEIDFIESLPDNF